VDECVSRDQLITALLILVGGLFDEVAVDKGGAGSHERDEVGALMQRVWADWYGSMGLW
jgi:hypothetical protein